MYKDDILDSFNTIQYTFIDLRRHNSLLVRLRDRGAGWKRRLFKKPRRTEWHIKRRLKTLNESNT